MVIQYGFLQSLSSNNVQNDFMKSGTLYMTFKKSNCAFYEAKTKAS